MSCESAARDEVGLVPDAPASFAGAPNLLAGVGRELQLGQSTAPGSSSWQLMYG